MTTRTILTAIPLLACVLLSPAAAAEPLVCKEGELGDLDGGGDLFLPVEYQTAIGDCDDFESCDDVNLIVGAPGTCASDVGPGCEGITVLVASPASCLGGPSSAGCDGVTVIDPLSHSSCVGGDGGPPGLA